MDDLLLLLILDHVSGGAYRSVVNFVGFLVAVGLFFAHPILGILGLSVWAVCSCVAALVAEAKRPKAPPPEIRLPTWKETVAEIKWRYIVVFIGFSAALSLVVHLGHSSGALAR